MWQALIIIISATLLHVATSSSPSTDLYSMVRPFDASIFSYSAQAHPDDNFVICPICMQTLAYLIRLGANDDSSTTSQIEAALGLRGANDTDMVDYYSKILEYYYSIPLFRIRSSIFMDDKIEFNWDYYQMAFFAFDTECLKTFFKDKEEAANDINCWAEERISLAINNTVSPDSFSKDTELMLVTVVDFDGTWAQEFDRIEYLDSSSTGFNFSVHMMSTKGLFNYGTQYDLGADIVEIPYKDRNLSMFVIIPKEGKLLSDVEDKLKEFTVPDLIKVMTVNSVKISIPIFKVEITQELSNPLRKMGIKSMFSRLAQLHKMTQGKRKLRVYNVIQKIFFQVNEQGGMPDPKNENILKKGSLLNATADRPFHYIIWDKFTKMTLFEGNFRAESPNPNYYPFRT